MIVEFPICSFRIESPAWCICKNTLTKHHKKRVKQADCQDCRVRGKIVRKSVVTSIPLQTPQIAPIEPPVINPLGTLTYARTGWEPPPCPPDYHRRSSDLNSDGAWILEPAKPICKHLKLSVAERGACGYCRVKRHCGLVDSFIGPRTCGTCQRRE